MLELLLELSLVLVLVVLLYFALQAVSDLLLSLLSSLSLPSFSCFIISNFISFECFLSISAILSESILSCKSLINLFIIVTILSGTLSVLFVSSSFVKSVFASSNERNINIKFSISCSSILIAGCFSAIFSDIASCSSLIFVS